MEYIILKLKTHTMQLTTRANIIDNFDDNEEKTLTEVKQELDLPNLYNFLHSLRNESVQGFSSSITFENRNLIDVGRSITSTLNKMQTYYHKYYVGAICVFVCIIKIPQLSKLTNGLKKPFFCSLGPILADILKFWTLHEQTPKSEGARTKIIAFLKSLYQMAIRSTPLLARVCNQDVLKILSKFQLPNDGNIIKLYCKLVFQAIKVGKHYNKEFALRLYSALKHPNFPTCILNRCLLYIEVELQSPDLVSSNSTQIVENLKRMLQQNLKARIEFVNSRNLVHFITSIESPACSIWRLTDLCLYCRIMQEGREEGRELKRIFLKQIGVHIISLEQLHKRQEVDDILDFACTFCEFEVMIAMMTKISNMRLVKLVMGGFLAKVVQVVADKNRPKHDRTQGLNSLAYIVHRFATINCTLCWQVEQAYNGLKELLRKQVNGPAIENTLIKMPGLSGQFPLW